MKTVPVDASPSDWLNQANASKWKESERAIAGEGESRSNVGSTLHLIEKQEFAIVRM